MPPRAIAACTRPMYHTHRPPPASCSSALLLCLLALFSAAAAENSLLPFLPLLPVPTDRQPRQGDGVGGEGYTILPVLRNEQPATVIILHGMGSTGEAWGFLSLALSFFSLNYVKFIIPTAPLTHVTYLDKQLRSWYDIRTFRQSAAANLSSLTPAQLLNLVDIDRPQFDNAVERVNDIIRSEVERGVNPQRILLLGFSQGGALALHAFLRSPWSLAAVIGVATWIPFIQEYPSAMSPATRNRHMLLMHVSFTNAIGMPRVMCCSAPTNAICLLLFSDCVFLLRRVLLCARRALMTPLYRMCLRSTWRIDYPLSEATLTSLRLQVSRMSFSTCRSSKPSSTL